MAANRVEENSGAVEEGNTEWSQDCGVSDFFSAAAGGV